MAHEDLSLPELIGRAYARALPPKKFTKLIRSRFLETSETQNVDDSISAAILPYLVPSPPSLILSYLSHLLSNTTLITSRTMFIHLLFYIHNHDLPSISSIISITNILSTHPTGLDRPIPSLLSPFTSELRIQPDVGPSTSTSVVQDQNQISTLSLLLPLLRISSTNSPNSISSLVGYLSKFISVLSAFPSPTLDVGLEAGQLLPSLPEEIGTHLRGLLSGLMTDLDNQDLMVQANQQHQQPNQDIQMGDDNTQNASTSQDIRKGESKLPLRQTIIFLLEYIKRMSIKRSGSSTTTTMDDFKERYRALVRVGKQITNDAEELLRVLLEVTIQGLVGSNVDTLQCAEHWRIVVEDVSNLLKWWKDNRIDDFGFPDDPSNVLSTLFQSLSPSMQTFSEQLSQRYSNLVQQAENEDDGSTFTPLEGWHLLSLQETLLSKFAQVGIINHEQGSAIAPGVNIYTFSPGESLTNRLSSESHPHLPSLVHTIQYSFGASSTFSKEVTQIIESCPVTPPPENIFNYIASQPGLLACLTTQISPLALLDLMQERLLDLGVDEQSRNDDPQGSLTRFGEGVALIEAFVAHHQLPLPPLLEDVRCAISFSHLDEESKECMDGWVKAIFGSDGIEDAILLATPPQKLYKLSPTLIQQAVAAVTASQIDLDTLHSGLSYFSQPLLSWCLGGVVAWLCKEIKRQGLLSAIHLVVLQDLILGHSCPEALIRVNSKGLNELLSPNSGLTPVFESSNFDLVGIRAKLDSLGLNASLPTSEIDLKGALNLVSQLDLAPAGWEKTLLDSLDAEVAMRGREGCLDIVLEQVEINQNGDLAGFVPLLLALSTSSTGGYTLLESLFGHPKKLLSPQTDDSLKRSLSYASALNSNSGQFVFESLVYELEYLVSLPVKMDDELSQSQDEKIRKKRKTNQDGGVMNKLNVGQREKLESLIRGLRDDELLRGRFGNGMIERLDRIL
ncbi:hypothetical protein I203_105216 [Kwoniella mangroviensis CBS 8507]|uniref:uncharacterized protein n=1 Tax=Kwoniella mangroviensis CBS 8507 TaxID=1296122 RepID=UPI00080CE003|nr:uncharacterized protein I203_01035 [Kwoniella mangroviensis CBS 8507]OCF69181.1 hypothetical protein I203_01035 [Kwoniella mangroviensis CBS 8507]